MINTINELIHYLKNPQLEKDSNTAFLYRVHKLFSLFIISIITTFTITFFTSFLEMAGILELGKHSVSELIEKFSGYKFLLLAVILAPLVEESIFRAPLVLFKKPRNFKIAFYSITILFGYMHIANYELNTHVLLFSPLLVAPQIFIGFYLAFIRVRFGLIWSIALHAAYNGFLFSLFLFAKNAIN